MSTITVAQPRDLPTLLHIDASSGPYPWPESALRRALSAEQVWLLEVAGDGVGFLVEQRVLDEASLLHLAVEGTRQGEGHGRALLMQWLGRLAHDGCRRCLLEVRVGNLTARRLYHRLGFTEIATRARYYRTDSGFEDAVVMEKVLIED